MTFPANVCDLPPFLRAKVDGEGRTSIEGDKETGICSGKQQILTRSTQLPVSRPMIEHAILRSSKTSIANDMLDGISTEGEKHLGTEACEAKEFCNKSVGCEGRGGCHNTAALEQGWGNGIFPAYQEREDRLFKLLLIQTILSHLQLQQTLLAVLHCIEPNWLPINLQVKIRSSHCLYILIPFHFPRRQRCS